MSRRDTGSRTPEDAAAYDSDHAEPPDDEALEFLGYEPETYTDRLRRNVATWEALAAKANRERRAS